MIRLVRMHVLATVFAISCVPCALANQVDLDYIASINGVQVGVISISLNVQDISYSLHGTAESRGLIELMRSLRVQFSAEGELVENTPRTMRYEYHHRDNRKERHVLVANDEVTYTRPGKPKRTYRLKQGMDLVSALWLAPTCSSMNEVHTGRTQYSLHLVSAANDQCQFKVISDDKDDDPFDLKIRYIERNKARVPQVIVSSGFFAGEIRLRDENANESIGPQIVRDNSHHSSKVTINKGRVARPHKALGGTRPGAGRISAANASSPRLLIGCSGSSLLTGRHLLVPIDGDELIDRTDEGPVAATRTCG